jgi:hypothetical protein
MYKLLCMVCVHLAAKVQGLFNRWTDGTTREGVPSVQTMLSFRGLSVLSQGEFSEQELSRMELVVLRALDWQLRSSVHDIFEWIDIMISLADIEHVNADTEAIRQRAFAHVKNAVGTTRLQKFAPSTLAFAVFNLCTDNDHRTRDLLSVLGICVNGKDVNTIENEMRTEALLRLA